MELRSVEDIVHALNEAKVQSTDRRWTCGQGTWLSAEEFASARWEEIRKDLKAPVIRRETLMTMKRMAARPQDLADIAELEEIQKLKEG